MNELGLPSMSELSLESATNEKRKMNFHDNFWFSLFLILLFLVFSFFSLESNEFNFGFAFSLNSIWVNDNEFRA